MFDILRRMKQYKDMYKFVSYVKEVNDKEHRTAMGFYDNLGKDAGLIEREDAIQHYMKVSNCDNREANQVCDAALLQDYIEPLGVAGNLEVTALEGHNFLAKLGRFRIGMWRDILHHYNSYSIGISLLALAVSIIGLIISIIIKSS